MVHGGSIVDATIIEAPSSRKNAESKTDPEMHSVKKGNKWYFGMRAHIGVDPLYGFVHTVISTAANEPEVKTAPQLLRPDDEGVSQNGEIRDRWNKPGLSDKPTDRNFQAPLRRQPCMGGRASDREAEIPCKKQSGICFPHSQGHLRVEKGTIQGPVQKPLPGQYPVCKRQPVQAGFANCAL